MIRACFKSVGQILKRQFTCFIMEHARFPLINNLVKDRTSMPSDKSAQRSTTPEVHVFLFQFKSIVKSPLKSFFHREQISYFNYLYYSQHSETILVFENVSLTPNTSLTSEKTTFILCTYVAPYARFTIETE